MTYNLKYFWTILLLLTSLQFSFAQNHNWARSMGSPNYDSGQSIVTDSSGNVYVTGFFQGTCDFDPSPNVFNLTSQGNRDIFVQKLNSQGLLLWALSFGSTGSDEATDITITPSGDILITGSFAGTVDFDPGPNQHLLSAGGSSAAFFQKIDPAGHLVWANSIASSSTANSIGLDAAGNIFIAGDSNNSFFIAKFTSNGSLVWTNNHNGALGGDDIFLDIDPQGNVLLTGSFQGTVDFDPSPTATLMLTSAGNSDIFIQKLDNNGQLIWAHAIGQFDIDNGFAIKSDALGNSYIVGNFVNTIDLDPGSGVQSFAANNAYDFFVLKLDPNGDYVWAKSLGGFLFDFAYDLEIDADNNLYITGQVSSSIDFDPSPNTVFINHYGATDAYLLKLDSLGNFILAQVYGGASDEQSNAIHLDKDNNIYLTGHYQGTAYFNPKDPTDSLSSEGGGDIFVLKLDAYSNYLRGNLFKDLNLDCIRDPTDASLSNAILRIDGQHTFYATTNAQGDYSILVDTGVYSINPALSFSGPYWQFCNPVTIHVDSFETSDTANIGIQALIDCPYMQVDLSAPFLRMTGQGSYYTVSYCNNGTIDAINTLVDVIFDPFLNVVQTSIPISNQNGNIFSFDLDTVEVGECGSFMVLVLVDTSAQFQQTHCSEAHIYPDSLCDIIWTNYAFDVNTNCPNNDTVYFLIENTGTAPSLNDQIYTIFEDDVIFKIDSIDAVISNGVTIVSVPAEAGKTYRLEIPQASNYPTALGDPIASAAIEGCNPLPNGEFHTGFITQFSNGHSSPFIAIDCQQNVGSFDPNDKAAQPFGYGPAHYIYDHTILDYKIRFQNTGTDTAFNIVILDTLSPLLDPSSLQMGASSHNYTWELKGTGILEVRFANIMLVDSNANEPLSHGFFKYRIHQKPNNPLESQIFNQAAIYFDYNPPIFTNTTFHTIGDNFVSLTVAMDQIYEADTEVLVYPNPFTHSTTIEVKGKSYESLGLQIYDLTGRQVGYEQASSNNKIQLSRGNLLPGVYIYKLTGDDQLITTGKVIVQ